MRNPQPEGTRGSLKWIQRAVERTPDLLVPPSLLPVTWVSPLRKDGFAEYRDAEFLRCLGLDHLAEDLANFWPKRGPQWDALGRAGNNVLLVEAKAHIPEFISPASQAAGASLAKISSAFSEVQRDLGLNTPQDWTQEYYQYANRLAHLSWLRSKGVAAQLIFVDFLHDTDMGGPSDAALWKAAYALADATLGLPEHHKLSAFIHHIYLDTRILS